jgi:GT2 family glycosyltransferase
LSAPPKTLFETSAECLGGETPVAVRLIDLEQGASELRLPASGSGNPYRRLLVLVRRGGYPVGWAALPVSPDGTVSLDALAAVLPPAAGSHHSPGELVDPPLETPTVATNGHGLPSSGLTPERPGRPRGESTPEGLPRKPTPEGPSRPPRSTAPAHAAQPLVSVVVATCANAESAVRCAETIQANAGGPCEVIVVENRPGRSTVARALRERFGDDERVRYVEEHRPGLASARNAGLRAARGEIVAFTDDDVLADPAWLPAVRAAFAAAPEVGCVTGLILPLELETPAQILLERFAGYGKGFRPRIYSLDEPPPDQPLFPYTAGYFGSGANMAFRTGVLRDLGGFDPVLGTGTPARGCEDLDICIRVLHAGSRLAYEPRAIVWHRHPDTHAGLRRRAFDYGAALGAMLTKHILTGPNRWAIVSRVPQGIRYYTDPKSRKNATRGPVFPRSLTGLERAGLLYGPLAYLASRLEARR